MLAGTATRQGQAADTRCDDREAERLCGARDLAQEGDGAKNGEDGGEVAECAGQAGAEAAVGREGQPRDGGGED